MAAAVAAAAAVVVVAKGQNQEGCKNWKCLLGVAAERMAVAAAVAAVAFAAVAGIEGTNLSVGKKQTD